jgi:hypothetical protein
VFRICVRIQKTQGNSNERAKCAKQVKQKNDRVHRKTTSSPRYEVLFVIRTQVNQYLPLQSRMFKIFPQNLNFSTFYGVSNNTLKWTLERKIEIKTTTDDSASNLGRREGHIINTRTSSPKTPSNKQQATSLHKQHQTPQPTHQTQDTQATKPSNQANTY